MKKLLILLAIGLNCSLFAQNSSKNWIIGGIRPTEKNVLIRIDSTGTIFDTLDFSIPIESDVATFSDSTGNLFFFTNGCSVFDAAGQIIENGDGLNLGTVRDQSCGKIGYIAAKGAAFLPFPGKESEFLILIHMGARYSPVERLTYGPLYFSVIDVAQKKIISKNKVLADGNLAPFSIVRQGNGRDWWIIAPEVKTNHFHIATAQPTGILPFSIEKTGPVLTGKRIGSTAFSLDGQLFGYKSNSELNVYDFDRCAGNLIFNRGFSFLERSFGGGGVAFSPDNRFVYATTQLAVYQADLTDSASEIDTAFIWNPQWGVSLGLLEWAPNGQIWIGGLNRTAYFSTIGNPSFSGNSLNFQPKGVELPFMHVRSVPNTPNFELKKSPGMTCDSLISTAKEEAILPPDFSVWPNPAQDELTIEVKKIDASKQYAIHFFDALGRQIFQKQIFGETSFLKIETMPNGFVVLEIRANGLPIFRQKILVEK